MVVFVVKLYAVREAKKWRYAVRNAKIERYAVRKGGGECHPHCWLTISTVSSNVAKINIIQQQYTAYRFCCLFNPNLMFQPHFDRTCMIYFRTNKSFVFPS